MYLYSAEKSTSHNATLLSPKLGVRVRGTTGFLLEDEDDHARRRDTCRQKGTSAPLKLEENDWRTSNEVQIFSGTKYRPTTAISTVAYSTSGVQRATW